MSKEETKNYLIKFCKDIGILISLSTNDDKDRLLSKVSELFASNDEYKSCIEDTDFMLECVLVCPSMFQCVSENLRKRDKDFISKAFKRMNNKDIERAISYVGENICTDKEFVLQCVQRGVYHNNFNSFTTDEDVMLAVAQSKPDELKNLSPSLRESVKFFERAIKVYPRALRYAAGKAISDHKFLAKALEANGDNIDCVRWPNFDHALSPLKFDKFRELALVALHGKKGEPLYVVESLPQLLRDDPVIEKEAIKSSSICYLGLNTKSDFCRDVDTIRQLYEKSPFDFDTIAHASVVYLDMELDQKFHNVLLEKMKGFNQNFHVKALKDFIGDPSKYRAGPEDFSRPFKAIVEKLDAKSLTDFNDHFNRSVSVTRDDTEDANLSKIFMREVLDECLHKKSIYAIQGSGTTKKTKRRMP